MQWSDLKNDIGKAAPILGTLVGGPLGGAVGGLISAALGTANTPDAVSAALATDPAAAEKIAELQINAKVQLQQIQAADTLAQLTAANNAYATEVDDRKDARKRQMETKDWFPSALAIFVTLGFFGSLAMLCFVEIPKANGPVVYLMIGSLGTAWAAVMNYEYGSTRIGSAQTSKVTDFAISPGSVSSYPALAAPTPSSTVNINAPQGGSPAVAINNPPPDADNNPNQIYRGS